MRTRWIGGRSSKRRPGGVRRRGPANETGLARSDQWGSVKMLTPSSWTRSVECPIHVTVGVPWLSRSARPSFATRTRFADLDRNVVNQMRENANFVLVQRPGLANSGFVLTNPPARWWRGASGAGSAVAPHPVLSSVATKKKIWSIGTMMARGRAAERPPRRYDMTFVRVSVRIAARPTEVAPFRVPPRHSRRRVAPGEANVGPLLSRHSMLTERPGRTPS